MARRQHSISKHIKKQTMIASTTCQIKESKSFPNEDTILELPDAEYKKLIYRMLQDIRDDLRNEIRQSTEKAKEHTDKAVEEIKRIIQEHSGKINKLQESIERQHSEIQKINSKITELDNSIGSQRSRIEQLECRLGELEDKAIDTNIAEEKSDKRIKKNEETLRIMWDSIKKNNLHVIGVPEQGGITENTDRIVEDLLAENFPDIMKDKRISIQDAHRTPYKIDPKRKSPRHIIIKLAKTKDKEKNLKTARDKRKVSYKGESIRISSDYSAETVESRKQWDDIYRALKEKNCQTRIIYPAKLSQI
ncbi:LINE-1 retrotransposable element ORF1 protein isoform X1 [Loxodonta africana]|uniref:LINE-1 retrotransposable element ORF1 protein isoform X1 n=1 Tax=Loxodonta africana TaxID=9785 RepID=UPI0030CF2D5C